MEHWVLQIVIVQRYERAEQTQEDAQCNLVDYWSRVRQASVSHETSGVDHVQLIDQLPWVLECRMEHETADTDKEVPEVCNAEDGVVAIVAAATDTEVGEVDKEQIREGIDYLG